MAAEFHFFPRLPWELREKIWKLVIRPAEPGVHVFRLCSQGHSSRKSEHRAFTDQDDRRPCLWWLAAPQCLPKGVDFSPASREAAPISWTLNNPSTYLIDSGLWTACKESMLIIEREFQAPARLQHEWSPSEVKSFRAKRGRFTLPETTTYKIFDHSSLRYFTIFPLQDLLILKPPEVSYFDMGITDDIFPSLVSHDNYKKIGRYVHSRNAALEYDPAWDKIRHNGVEHRTPNIVRDIVESTSMSYTFSIWFIDYRIKRNPRHDQEATEEQADKSGDGPATVFYANDRRFVEVKKGQLGRTKGHRRMWDAGYEVETKDDEEPCSCCGSDGFMMQLQDFMDELDAQFASEDFYFPGAPDCIYITYRLLACEYV
ncbi:uncharacterized protein B0H64DRAFT_409989 [Chaetomium fimeti]|uniref:2EXR domain-containing protein n=1 Tax=Chaetomium fimeti TaxID=1854472 RepID=A0AAE0H734_9PEZI|nr:hypothetical protein B0H64DRAFT_409989 [Chaetomium fimeti]